MKQHQNQQRPQAPAPGFAQARQFRGIANPLGRYNVGVLVPIGLVACLITLLLGTQVFGTASASGSTAGYWLGYVLGGVLRRSALYLSIPFWLAAWVYVSSSLGSRFQFEWSRLLPCLLFTFYALMQLLTSDPVWAARSFERLFISASIVLLALPLCYRKGVNLFWMGMAVAGLLFFTALLFSGQLFSILRGQGLIGVAGPELTGRLTLGADTITSASVMYQCVLAGVFWLLASPRKVGLWLVGIPILASLCGMAILTGSKGPLLAFGVALLTIFSGKGFKGAIYGLLAVGMVVAVLWNGQEVLNHYSGAVDHLSIGLQEPARTSYYESVFRSVPTFLGNGVGSWAFDSGFAPGYYVHNSLLEVYFEMGLVGAGLFLWAVGSVGLSLLRVVRTHRDPVAGFVLAYFVYGLVFSMISGSIFGDTVLLLGMVLGCTRFSAPLRTGAVQYTSPVATRRSFSPSGGS